MWLRIAGCALLSGAVALAQSRLTNLSVRSVAGSGTETLIVGFAVGGTGTKPVLIRGIGPALTAFGVAGVVTEPALALYSGEQAIAQNDRWGGTIALTAAAAAVGAFALPADSRDAALLSSLQPGVYSAQLIATSGTGVALVECYDADFGLGSARFTNISARSVAGTGASVLTAGFSISGTGAKTLLIRGVGPTLGTFGLDGALANPRLRLFDSAGRQIGDNDDWVSAVSPLSVFNSVGAFALPAGSRDSVLFLGLTPGTYTAQISGSTAAPGAALIEVYEVNASPVPVVTLAPIVNVALPGPADPGAGTASPGPDAIPSVRLQARPVYPFELRAASVTGEVLVDFYIKSDGTVANAVALWATDVRFAAAAVAAVQAWVFTPGRRNGQLVTFHFQVPIIFELNQ